MQPSYNRTLLIVRSALFWVALTLSTIIMAIPVLLGGLISYPLGLTLARKWAQINLLALKVTCNLSGQVEGLENIPAHACIIMSKHQSTFETFFITHLFPRFTFVAKRSLTLIPIFGWALLVVRFILIDRKSGRSAVTQMVEQSKLKLADDHNVVVFPEGTRIPVGAPTNYRAGGAIVASKLGADVIPIAHNAGEFWPRMGFIKWPGKVTVCIGPVIKGEGKTPDQILNEVETWIETKMAEITVLDRFPYQARAESMAKDS